MGGAVGCRELVLAGSLSVAVLPLSAVTAAGCCNNESAFLLCQG